MNFLGWPSSRHCSGESVPGPRVEPDDLMKGLYASNSQGLDLLNQEALLGCIS